MRKVFMFSCLVVFICYLTAGDGPPDKYYDNDVEDTVVHFRNVLIMPKKDTTKKKHKPTKKHKDESLPDAMPGDPDFDPGYYGY